MIVQLFAIKDVKSRFMEPYSGLNKATVQRDIMNIFKNDNSKNSPIVMNPEDYQIFKVGEFDNESGLIVSTEQEFVCNVVDLANLVRE